MSLQSGFVFPSKDFKLIFMETIGYISDNVLYRVNLVSNSTQIVHHPKGKSYQALTTNHKRGLVVLADYSQNPTLYFQYLHQKQLSFEMQNFCQLQIQALEISLDCKYLLVACGVPDYHILLIDVQKKTVVQGKNSKIELERNGQMPIKIEFNPGNSKIFCIMYPSETVFYDIENVFQISDEGSVKEAILFHELNNFQVPEATKFQTFIWDQLNNVYLSNGRNIIVYSTDTCQQVITYQIENQESGSNQQMVMSMLLTPKHLIVLYKNGRIQWLNKFYPDLLEYEQPSERPFFLDKFYEVKNNIKYAVYDHKLQKILIALEKGFFMILDQPAQTKQADEEDQDKNEKAQKDKINIKRQLQLQPRIIGPYHFSSVVLIRQITDTSVYVTVSSSGRIIFWSLTQKKPITYYDSHAQVVSADLNRYDNVLALGTKNGVVQFYSIANNNSVYLFKQFRLTHGTPLGQVIFSTNSQELAVLSKQQKRIYFILTHLSMPFEILGYTILQHQPKHMCWNSAPKIKEKPKFQYLLVCIGYGVLMINSPAAVSAKKKGKQFALQCEKYALRTDLQQQIIGVLPSGEIVTTGADKFLKKYKQPQELEKKVDFKSRIPIPAPLQQIEAHDLETIKMIFSKKCFVSGGQDGTIQFRSYAKFNQVKQIQAHGCYSPSISAVGASQFDSIYYSCGKDGSVYVWTVGSISISASDSYQKQAVKFTKIETGGKSLKYYEEIAQQQYLQKMKDVINKKKKAQFQKIDKIKKQLKQLLAQNQKHDELQRLQRDQFAIDLQSRQRQSKSGQQLCQKIKEQSKKSILYRQVYTKKLKEITWDKMKIHLRAINGLKSNYLVYNYQIRNRSQSQLRTVKLILDLRKSQLKQLKKKKPSVIDPDFHKNKNVVNGGIPTPLIFNSSEKKVDKKQQKTKKKKQQQVQVQKQPTEEIMSSEQWILIYSAFETFSINSKKNQIVMMKNLIIKVKEIFNSEFNKLMQLRQNQNQMINDKNKRIIEICEELKRPNEIIIGNKNILENPQTILDVRPQHILFKRYLSRDQRQKLQKERLKQEQRLRLLAQDDSSQRALQKMMGGTLQEKKTSVLQVTVDRQKWMDKPLQQMTEQEKMKLKQFQVKKQKAEEEKQRIIKKLQAELRKLKQQIQDIMDKYDQKLFTLLKRRIQYDYRIEQQQLYCAKLALSIVNAQQSSKKGQQLHKQIQAHQSKLHNMQAQISELASHQQQFIKARDAKKANLDMRRLGELENKIRPIQKTVFEDIGTNVKKRRQMEEKIKQRDSTAQYQLLDLDPLHEIQFKYLSSQKARQFNFFIPEIKAAQQHYQIPQNTLMQVLQTRFQAKKQQSQLEKKVKILKDSLVKTQKIYQQEKTKFQQQKVEITKIQTFIQQLKSDLEIQIRINQGQVEINNATPVPQLDDALLISRSEIDAKNQDIMTNAQQKIGVMEAIKQSKIAVTKETLNLQRKQQLIAKLSSLIKQIQMLKVKKEMQVALAKKDTKNNENQMKSLKTRIQDLRKQGDKRISIFQKKIQQLQKQIENIHKENKQLEVQRYNLENTVKQREKIKDMMCGENGEGNQEAAEKFEQIAINRKLFDKAKQQTQEIQLLREELSKLKAKTFANFSNVNR